MSDLHFEQPLDDQGQPIGRDPKAVIADIQAGGDKLMASVEELIEWTDVDVSLVVDYLKRIANFLDAVIEANPKTYSIAELTDKLGIDETTLRVLLKNVGVQIETGVSDSTQTLTWDQLIPLLADRAGSREGERLAELLRGEGPYVGWV
jgi:hypothetical protein